MAILWFQTKSVSCFCGMVELWDYRAIGLVVSWFRGVLVYVVFFVVLLIFNFVVSCCSGFKSFKVSEIQRFENHLMFLKILIPYYQISISCFQEDIDPISKIFKK